MYDFPASRDANDRLWASISAGLSSRGLPAPAARAQVSDFPAFWSDPELILGQTCGYPLQLGLTGEAEVIGTPTYAAPGCGEGSYRSALVVRKGEAAPLADFRGKVAAINEPGSQSGFNTFAAAVAGLGASDAPFFSGLVVTGAHIASARAVAARQADIAALDAVTWAVIGLEAPSLHEDLEVIGWTEPAPALPFITAATYAGEAALIRDALAEAIALQPPHPAIPVAIAPAQRSDYSAILEMAGRAQASRFAPELAAPALPA